MNLSMSLFSSYMEKIIYIRDLEGIYMGVIIDGCECEQRNQKLEDPYKVNV